MAKRTTKPKKKVRSPARLGTLDEFLKDQGKLDKFQAKAIKEILADKLSKP